MKGPDFGSLDLTVAYLKGKIYFSKLNPSDCVEVRSCPCGSKDWQHLYEAVNSSGQVATRRSMCLRCGLVTYTRIPSQEWFHAHYRKNWQKNQTAANIQAKIATEFPEFFQLLDRNVQDRSFRIFEIGAGYGGILQRFRQRGFSQVSGLDLSESRVEYCRSKLGLNVVNLSAEEAARSTELKKDGPFDVVISYHVVEHIYDLASFFGSLRELVRPQGLLILGVPSLSSELSPLRMTLGLSHLHAFSKNSMQTLLAQSGFELLEAAEDNKELRIVARNAGRRLESEQFRIADVEKTIKQSRKLIFHVENLQTGFWVYASKSAGLFSENTMKFLELAFFRLRAALLRLDPFFVKSQSRTKLRAQSALHRILRVPKGFEVRLKVEAPLPSEAELYKVRLRFPDDHIMVSVK